MFKRCCLALCSACSLWFFASANAASHAEIAIIIDDIGYHYTREKQLMDLPAKLTYAILPDAPYTQRLTDYATARGHEIILHLPMQGSKAYLAEPNTLTSSMTATQIKQQVAQAISRMPQAIGVNNHMGSILTQNNQAMMAVMRAIAVSNKSLYFIDSFTSSASVAYHVALSYDIPALKRDVFLDADRRPASIQAALNKLISIATHKGQAIGIAHPYPETIAVLKQNLPNLKQKNIHLVNVSQLLPTYLNGK